VVNYLFIFFNIFRSFWYVLVWKIIFKK
jgi:hypothetical protein